jgi:hypothetical protein
MPRRAVELTKCFITGDLTRDIAATIYGYTGDNQGLAKNLFNSYVRLKLYILYLIVSHRDAHIMLEFKKKVVGNFFRNQE